MKSGSKRGNRYDRPMFLVLALCIGATLISAPAGAFDLITDEEARMQKQAFGGATTSGGIGRAPSIEIRGLMKGTYNVVPFNLEIYFKAFNGAKINPSSIQILYWSNPRRDLTERLKPFLKHDVITVNGAKAPHGVHEIQILVQDSKGLGRTAMYVFTID